MHNLIPYNQLAGEESFDPDNDLIADYYECLVECDESQSVCKRICKEVLIQVQSLTVVRLRIKCYHTHIHLKVIYSQKLKDKETLDKIRQGFYTMCMDNLITEVGFLLLGGLVAAIPIYIMGMILKGNE